MFLKNKLLILIFAISLLAHVVIIYVMARSTTLPVMAEMEVTEQPVIQAKLIFELPVIAEPPKEEAQEPEQEQEQEQEQAKVTPTEPAKTQEIEDIVEDTAIVEDSASQAPTEEPLAKVEEEVSPQPTEVDPFFQKSTVTPQPSSQNPLTSMARRHLSHFQQQQRLKVAEQASRDYQQQKNSPIIDAEVEDKFLTEDEKFRKSQAIRADCSSAGKKTAAVLLSFLGGQVDCSKPPPINSFIQDRINKTTQLPSLEEEQKTRPKSVVIQD